MSDGILNGLGLAELADYFSEVDLEYTWPQEPQTMTHSDEVAQLRARIAELESERATLRLSLNTTNVIVNDQIGKIADLIKERDAAITECIKRTGIEQDVQHYKERAEQFETDARELAGYAFISFPADVHYVSDEQMKNLLHLCEKYLKQ